MKRTALKPLAEPVDAAAERAGIKAAAHVAEIQRAAVARANAFPPFPMGVDVSADAYGWRHGGANVSKDDGPARDGERRITLVKVQGNHQGETVQVRRSRVWLTRDRN